MKKILLAGINSKFNHVSLSTRALESYVKKYSSSVNKDFHLQRKDFTINQPLLQVLKKIISDQPDCLLVSVYIWNIDYVKKIITEVKKLLPECLIGAGGPEVSYSAEDFLLNNSSVDFIMCGEGEKTLLEFCEKFSSPDKKDFLPEIKGIYLRRNKFSSGQTELKEPHKEIYFTGNRPLIQNLDELPFVYQDETGSLVSDIDPENSIIYYESSRGCPFRCSYCLSSIDKSVRFKSLDLVKKELSFFLEHNVRLVKFVDRTYNLNEDRYIEIWKFITQNWNSKTTFHFEIEVQQLTEKALDFLSSVKANCMQFEIGIQSTNALTLNAINRKNDLQKIHDILSRIPETIHVHLDLIAGLPFESMKEFSSSFNYTFLQKPRMLQLGFLKILHGTQMEQFAIEHEGYKWLSTAPYEVLQSPWLNYSQIQILHNVDYLVDNIYNSQNFIQTMNYLLQQKIDFFSFFLQLEKWFTKKNLFEVQHKADAFFSFLYEFVNDYSAAQNQTLNDEKSISYNEEKSVSYNEEKSADCNKEIIFSPEQKAILNQLLRFDFVRRVKTSSFPSWYERCYDKEKHRNALESYCNIQSTREAYINSAYEEFSVNPFTFEIPSDEKKYPVLFLFNTNNFRGAASRTSLSEENTMCILLTETDLLRKKLLETRNEKTASSSIEQKSGKKFATSLSAEKISEKKFATSSSSEQRSGKKFASSSSVEKKSGEEKNAL